MTNRLTHHARDAPSFLRCEFSLVAFVVSSFSVPIDCRTFLSQLDLDDFPKFLKIDKFFMKSCRIAPGSLLSFLEFVILLDTGFFVMPVSGKRILSEYCKFGRKKIRIFLKIRFDASSAQNMAVIQE
jgi:hypothetical protein